MAGEIRNIGRHTLIYGAGIVASKLVSFIMLPIYTRYLTLADYGVLELLSTTIDVIGMIGGIGLASGMFKHYAEAKTEDARNHLISTVTVGNSGLALIITIIGLIVSPWLTHMLFGPAMTPMYFRLFFLIYLTQSIGNFGLAFIQVEERSTLFVVLNVVKLFVTLSLTIYFVIVLRWTIGGILLANLIANSVFATGILGYTFRRVGLHFSRTIFGELSHFGLPVALWMIGSFILTFSDRYFLNYFTGASAVGLYSIAYKFGFILSAIAVAPFAQVWEPRRFAIASDPDAGRIYRRMFLYLNLALFGGAIVIALFVKDMLTVMTDVEFVPAYRLVPLLLITTIIQQWTGYCNFGLFLKNATNLYAWSAVIGVVAALALNFALIPPFGMLGAAWATVIAYALRFIPVYVFSQRKYHIDYPWGKIGILCLAFGAILVVRRFADPLGIVLSSAVNVLLLTLSTVFFYRAVLESDERDTVRAFASRLRSFRIAPAVNDTP